MRIHHSFAGNAGERWLGPILVRALRPVICQNRSARPKKENHR
jgi:hypothetical protein